jgi:hypothetical protein
MSKQNEAHFSTKNWWNAPTPLNAKYVIFLNLMRFWIKLRVLVLCLPDFTDNSIIFLFIFLHYSNLPDVALFAQNDTSKKKKKTKNWSEHNLLTLLFLFFLKKYSLFLLCIFIVVQKTNNFSKISTSPKIMELGCQGNYCSLISK